MAKKKAEPAESAVVLALRKFANSLPETEEGTSCVNRAFRARKKAFAYLGMKPDVYKLMVKLGDSLGDAEALQRKRPDNFKPGLNGWTTVLLPHDDVPSGRMLERWIEESYRLLVHPSLVAQLSGGSAAKGTKRRAAKATGKKTVTKKGPAKKKANKTTKKAPTKKISAKKVAKKKAAKKATTAKRTTKKKVAKRTTTKKKRS